MPNDLIKLTSSKSILSESMRTLRTNLQFSIETIGIKSILFTSAVPGEGKSTLISNLSISFAQTSKRILIIDCDLRKPKIHSIFKLSNSSGLTNVLINENLTNECILPSEFPNLSILPSGPVPPNPSELLGTVKMKRVLAYLEKIYDVIFIDTPPVIPVTDAQILSALVGGVVLVTSYGVVEKKALIKSKELLDKVGAKILGVVINKVPKSSELGYINKAYYQDYYEKS